MKAKFINEVFRSEDEYANDQIDKWKATKTNNPNDDLIARIKELWDWHKKNDEYYYSMNGRSRIEQMIEFKLEEEDIEEWTGLSSDILAQLVDYLEEGKRNVEIDIADEDYSNPFNDLPRD